MKIKNLLAILAALVFSASVSAKQHTGLEIKVNPVKSSIGNDEDVTVKVSIKNRTGEKIDILRWFLPDSDGILEEGIFKVTRDGEAVDYMGPHYKRQAATVADYVLLKPNQKLNFQVELSAIYDFSVEGAYQISMDTGNFELFGLSKPGKSNNQNRNTSMKSDLAADIYVTKVVARKGKPCNPRKEDCGGDGGGGDPVGDVSFTGSCSNSEQNTILSALAAAKDMTNDSVSYLNGNAGSRYTTWFGTYSNSRWNKVSGNFDAIKDALDNEPKTFDCKCNQSYFAYVYPNQPYKIYLCRAFWNARLTGTDSQGGTIIHEMSHYNAVAGTDDIVYGQSGAQNLADSDPNGATNNADSHEYFAENTPNLD
jgi:peptidyl-Lys metalloendopeptidase